MDQPQPSVPQIGMPDHPEPPPGPVEPPEDEQRGLRDEFGEPDDLPV